MSNELLMAHQIGLSSAREFKALKREELKEVQRAFDKWRLGCAASPAFNHVEQFEELLEKMIDAQSAAKWGR